MKAKPRPRKMKLAHMEECFVRLAAQLPDPKTELSFSSPFTLLVAVVLSAQATAPQKGCSRQLTRRRKWSNSGLMGSPITSAPSGCST